MELCDLLQNDFGVLNKQGLGPIKKLSSVLLRKIQVIRLGELVVLFGTCGAKWVGEGLQGNLI